MKNGNTEKIRTRVLSLIEAEYDSDAAFERALGLAEKTVNNWRRERSSSFMKMLPTLSDTFGVNIGELLDMPLRGDSSELSDEEMQLLHLYRRSHTLPPKMRTALRETLETTINLYLSTASELNPKSTARKSTKSPQGGQRS